MINLDELKSKWWNEEIGAPELYMPLEHPYFTDWNVAQKCQKRFELIVRSVSLLPKTLLDIGCHTGWFCRQFSKHGWKTIGIDKNPLEIEIAEELMAPWNGLINPKYICQEVEHTKLPSVDIILCLSVIMYFFKEHGEEAWSTMNRISKAAPIMFIDFGGMYEKYLPFNVNSFGKEMLTHTAYTDCTYLGYTDFENRPFFMLSR